MRDRKSCEVDSGAVFRGLGGGGWTRLVGDEKGEWGWR